MKDSTSIPAILKQAEIFEHLTPEQLELIASISTLITCNAGDMVIEQGTASDELYVIADGEVDIFMDPSLTGESSISEQIIITTLRRGQSFGEMALVDQEIRSASARCGQQDTRLVVIPRIKLMELCQAHPALGYRLMHNLAADLATKIRTADTQMREWLTWSQGRSL
jgi:CRP-like cAMP-binding protein